MRSNLKALSRCRKKSVFPASIIGRLRAVIAGGFLPLLAGALPAQDIAVWGWQAKAWSDLLQEHLERDAHILAVPGHSAQIPPDAWNGGFKVVILGRGAPESLSQEEREQVRHFLENGGFLVINSSMPP